jgi:monothiol glutaredoxin
MSTSDTEKRIRDQLAQYSILLYMKGTPDAPECGFSGAAVAALKKTGIAFNYVNVLANPFIRERLPRISQWPTYPQLFVQGELIGGADIIKEMQDDGSLQSLLEAVPDARLAAKPESKPTGNDLSLPVIQ